MTIVLMTMLTPRRVALASLLGVLLHGAGVPALQAQDSASLAAPPGAPPATARGAVPIRTLGDITAADSGRLQEITGARHLRTGGVLVNDPKRRQLVVYSADLREAKVVADTSSNTPNPYGLRSVSAPLIPYRGDSTLFTDLESSVFLVYDEAGRYARVMAPVRSNDLGFMGNITYGLPVFDPQGRLVYRSVRRSPSQEFNPQAGSTRTVITGPDSAPLLRMDFDRRTVDTIAMLKVSPTKSVLITGTGFMLSNSMINPLPQSDEWTMLADGTLAIVRTQDYHIDWIAPNGTRTAGPRIPFDWKRISLDEKQAMIDSVKRAEAERIAKLPPPPPPPPGMPAMPANTRVPVDPADLPDYYPPVRQGQVRADPDGNLWVLPSTTKDAKDGLLFDVVGRDGALRERVQLPPGRALVGFGPGGIVYLSRVYSLTSAVLERARVVR